MAVREVIQTPEQKSMEQAVQAQREDEFASELAKSMDLPSTLANAVDEQAKQPEKQEVEEKDEQETNQDGEEKGNQEEENLQVEEETEQEKSEEPESEEEEEDLIPKSKVQKRFDELTREKAHLEARLRRLEEQSQKAQEASDPEMKKLEAMDEATLKNLKRNVRLEQIKNSGKPELVAQYFDLEEKIDQAISTAPQRFRDNQNKNFVDAVSDTASTLQNFEKVRGNIFKIADQIYSSSPELMGSVTGKQRAWQIAVNQFSAMQPLSEGKSKQVELERQVNTLKKKISVDTTSKKTVSQSADSMEKMYKKAKYGTSADKEAFFRKFANTDAMFTDDELSRYRR